MPICCISGLVVAEVSTGSGRRTPEKDGVSQLFREQLLGVFYQVALRRSEAVMGNLRADTPESTSVGRKVPEVSLNRRKIDQFEIFRSKMTAVTSTTLPTSGLAWALHRFQSVSHPKNNSFQVPAAPFKRGLGRMAHSYYFACNPNSSWHNKPKYHV